MVWAWVVRVGALASLASWQLGLMAKQGVCLESRGVEWSELVMGGS